jgi:Tfp pilus assembly protein PilO
MVEATKISKWEEYKYAIMVGVGSVFLFFILIFLVGSPLYREYKKASTTLKEKQTVLTKLEEKLTNLKTLKSTEAELKEKNAKVMAALPTDKDVSRLFVQFENIANQNGLSIATVQEATATAVSTPTPAPASTSVRAVSYTVTGATSDYGSLKSALTKLEEALRILSVSKVEVTGATGNSTLNITLTVSTYLRSE